ncbi:MAG: alpha/beta fold hydrolase [Acidobacteria bacterium]|nr:alpha/beta fold hydrolase [Acidobacteriota bacterium]
MLPAGTELGPYRIEEALGFGGMGQVYRAIDTRLDRAVAIKMLLGQLVRDEKSIRRFHMEAKAVAALNHPNILALYDFRTENGLTFAVTEFLAGDTLRAWIQAGPLRPDQVREIAMQAAQGLAAAHTRGIIHCDLKPDNIFITQEGVVKILDFGLAKFERDKASESQWSGTLAYASPEQLSDNQSSAASDLFSLGVICIEALTGQHPFLETAPLKTLYAILHRDVAWSNIQLPSEWRQLLQQLVDKDPHKRFHDAEILLAAFRSLKSVPGAAPTSSILEQPPVRYAQSGNVNIAFQVVGDGPIDMVFVMGWVSHLEYFWNEPHFAGFLSRLASFTRLIVFDKRGTGLSDRVPIDQLPSLEQRMDDVRAVMEAVGSERAVLFGVSEGGPLCSLFAATYPHRTLGLIMFGSYARRIWAPDYPWAPTQAQREAFFEVMRKEWGGPVGIEERAPSLAQDPAFREWWGKYLRMGASPGAALALTRMNAEIDVRHILPTIEVPTLVLHRRQDRCLKWEEGALLADRIPDARLVLFEGADHLPFIGQVEPVLSEIEAFCQDLPDQPETSRILASVLCIKRTPVQRDTPLQRQLSDPFRQAISRVVDDWRGSVWSLDGGKFLASFDGPARSVRCALELLRLGQTHGERLSAGIHTGECFIKHESVTGLTQVVSRQIAAHAPANTILVSETLKDLVAGSGLVFEMWDSCTIDGLASPLNVFQVSTES